MDQDTEIRERIEGSFGDGPPLSHADVLPLGQRALRRRRRLVAGAAAVAVLAVGGTTVAVADRIMAGPGPAGPQVAGSPSASPTPTVATPTPATPTRAEISRALHRPLADYDGRGRLVLDPEARVLTRIDDPFTHGQTDHSVGLELLFHGATYWLAQYHSSDGSGGGSAIYSGYARPAKFEPWVLAQDPGGDTNSSVGPDVWPGVERVDLVRFAGGTERLEAIGGTRILRQRAHVSVGSSFAGPADHTAAAKVVAADGRRFYVLARSFDGKPGQYIAVPESVGGPTLGAFLDVARTKYATGGGGLL